MFHLKYKVVPQYLSVPMDHDLVHFSVTVKMEMSVRRPQYLPPQLEVMV